MDSHFFFLFHFLSIFFFYSIQLFYWIYGLSYHICSFFFFFYMRFPFITTTNVHMKFSLKNFKYKNRKNNITQAHSLFENISYSNIFIQSWYSYKIFCCSTIFFFYKNAKIYQHNFHSDIPNEPYCFKLNYL